MSTHHPLNNGPCLGGWESLSALLIFPLSLAYFCECRVWSRNQLRNMTLHSHESTELREWSNTPFTCLVGNEPGQISWGPPRALPLLSQGSILRKATASNKKLRLLRPPWRAAIPARTGSALKLGVGWVLACIMSWHLCEGLVERRSLVHRHLPFACA